MNLRLETLSVAFQSPVDGIFVMSLFAALFSIPAAWWQFARAKPSLTSTEEIAALAGLLCITASFVFPLIVAFSPSFHRGMDTGSGLVGCWILSGCAFVLSFFVLREVRVFLLIASLTTALLWTLVPKGIL